MGVSHPMMTFNAFAKRGIKRQSEMNLKATMELRGITQEEYHAQLVGNARNNHHRAYRDRFIRRGNHRNYCQDKQEVRQINGNCLSIPAIARMRFFMGKLVTHSPSH